MTALVDPFWLLTEPERAELAGALELAVAAREVDARPDPPTRAPAGWAAALVLQLLLATSRPPLLAFTVSGRPEPKGSLTYFPPRRGQARGRYVEDNPRSAPWRARVAAAGRRAVRALEPAARQLLPADRPVLVVARYTFSPPAAARKTGPIYPDRTGTTGDLDKLDRNLYDALTDARVVRDDARVIGGAAEKRYRRDGWEGATVSLYEVAP